MKAEIASMQERLSSRDNYRRDLVSQNAELIKANRDIVAVVDDLKRKLNEVYDDFY